MSYEVEVQIEIPVGSRIKYEIDHNTGKLRVDRILHTPVYYFFNYGYIPNTLSGDGDPLDAIVLCNEKITPTAYITCKIVGVIKTWDESGEDDKMLLVPIDKIDRDSSYINNDNDLPEYKKQKLICFFEDYKKMEPGKWVKIDKDFKDRDEALKIYKESLQRYQDHLAEQTK